MLRPAYLPVDPAGRTVYAAGQIAQYDFWFPEIEVPVGCGQSRTAKQLPVWVMVVTSAYCRLPPYSGRPRRTSSSAAR